MFKTQMSMIILELVTSYKGVRWKILLISGSTMISTNRTRWIIVTTFLISSRKRTLKITRLIKVNLRNKWLYLSNRVDSKVLKLGILAKSKICTLKILIPNLMKSRKKNFIRGPKSATKCTELFSDRESMGPRSDRCPTWKESSRVSHKAACKDSTKKSTPNSGNHTFHQERSWINCKAKPSKRALIWTVLLRIETRPQSWTLSIRLPNNRWVSNKKRVWSKEARRRHLTRSSRTQSNRWPCSIQITSEKKANSSSESKARTARHFKLAPWEEETTSRPKRILSSMPRVQVRLTP